MEGKYKAWQVDKFKGDPAFRDVDHRSLQDHELLVKIKCATIHPADLALVNGQYGICPTKFPFIPGMEGSGEIVQVGKSIDKNLIGKKTALFVKLDEDGGLRGLWAEFRYCLLEDLFIVDFDIEYEKLCFAIGNPFTAYAFLDTLRQHNVKTVVQNGASGNCGKIFCKLCVKENIEIINVVRKEDHFAYFKEIGAKHMISTSNKDWKNQLSNLCKELNVRICFECVGGNYTGDMLSCLPPKSILYHFGNLELKRLGNIQGVDLVTHQKSIRGWWLMKWMKNTTQEELQKMKNYVFEEIKSGKDTFDSSYSKVFSLDKFIDGLMYYLQNMSGGKVILKS